MDNPTDTGALLPVTQADEALASEIISILASSAVGQGRGKRTIVPLLARHRHQSGRTGAGEALDKRIFLTCVSGGSPSPYLKVHFNTLADAHAAHDQLLGTKP